MCWVFWLCCGSSCYPDTTGSPHQLVRQENELDEVPCEEESTDEESEQDIDIEGFARTEHYTPGQSPHFHVVQDFYQRWMPLMFVVLFFLLFFCCCCFFVCFFFAEPGAPNTVFEFAGARELLDEEDIITDAQHKTLLSMKRFVLSVIVCFKCILCERSSVPMMINVTCPQF